MYYFNVETLVENVVCGPYEGLRHSSHWFFYQMRVFYDPWKLLRAIVSLRIKIWKPDIFENPSDVTFYESWSTLQLVERSRRSLPAKV